MAHLDLAPDRVEPEDLHDEVELRGWNELGEVAQRLVLYLGNRAETRDPVGSSRPAPFTVVLHTERVPCRTTSPSEASLLSGPCLRRVKTIAIPCSSVVDDIKQELAYEIPR